MMKMSHFTIMITFAIPPIHSSLSEQRVEGEEEEEGEQGEEEDTLALIKASKPKISHPTTAAAASMAVTAAMAVMAAAMTFQFIR